MKAFPVTAPAQTPGPGCPRLEYRVYLFTTGPVVVWAYLDQRGATQVAPIAEGAYDVIAVDTKGTIRGTSSRPLVVLAGETIRADVDVAPGGTR